jgi:hypothetical protein
MLNRIKNLVLTASSFLNSNQAPPGVDLESADRLKSVNHLESKKFYAVCVSVLILSFFYFTSVAALFFVPHVPEVVTGFVTIFSKTTEILAVIIASYVGAQAAVDLKYGSSSSASVADSNQTTTQTIDQNTNQTIEQTTTNHTITENITVIHSNAKEDDYEIH